MCPIVAPVSNKGFVSYKGFKCAIEATLSYGGSNVSYSGASVQ